jgi:hypothetical protein
MDHRHLSQMDRNLAVEAKRPRQPANRAAAWLTWEIRTSILPFEKTPLKYRRNFRYFGRKSTWRLLQP